MISALAHITLGTCPLRFSIGMWLDMATLHNSDSRGDVRYTFPSLTRTQPQSQISVLYHLQAIWKQVSLSCFSIYICTHWELPISQCVCIYMFDFSMCIYIFSISQCVYIYILELSMCVYIYSENRRVDFSMCDTMIADRCDRVCLQCNNNYTVARPRILFVSD